VAQETDLWHRNGRSGNGDGGWLGTANGTAAPTPVSSRLQHMARDQRQAAPEGSSPPCADPGWLHDTAEATRWRIDGGGAQLGFHGAALGTRQLGFGGENPTGGGGGAL
jgi:hypothetical protein